MKNNMTTPTSPADSNSSFGKLLSNYSMTYHNRHHDPDAYEHALYHLATAVAYSTLRKCYDVSGNPVLRDLRANLSAALAYMDQLTYASNHAYATTYDSNGDPVRTVADHNCKRALDKLISETLGDGLDLVHDAVVAIQLETDDQIARDPDLSVDLERPFTKRALNSKVWIRTEDSIGGWKDLETTPIQEIFRASRRAIEESRSVKFDPKSGFLYLEDLAIDPESGDTEKIYRRTAKYADLGGDGRHGRPADYIPGQPAGLDGRPTSYTADRDIVDHTDDIIARLHLTSRQATILAYRQRGWGYKAIATAMGVSRDNVRGQVSEIKRKWRNAGFQTPQDTGK